MSRVYFKLNAGDIRKAVKKKCADPIIALSKNPNVMRQLAEKAGELVEPYVPMKSGALRKSFHVIYHAKQVQLVWGDYKIGSSKRPTFVYADIQHDANDMFWNRTTPGTTSYWTHWLMRGTFEFKELVDYAEPLVKKEIKKNGR